MHLLKTPLILLLTLFSNAITNAQLVQRTGSIFTAMSKHIEDMPGDAGDEYAEPNAVQLDIWENILTDLIAGKYIDAANKAESIAYTLVEFRDTTKITEANYLMLEAKGTNFWGTYVYNPNFCRSLVIQSPHARRDANTGLQGIHIFQKTEAIFFQVNGTHRCNSSAYSVCTGTTTSCGATSEAYRISDLAHTTQSLFQKTTEFLLNTFDDAYFIQLHGFTKQDTDPYVILSNGTQVAPALDFMSIFRENLALEDDVLTFKIAHVDTDWTRLRGFWNTQGRLINQHPTPCDSDAKSSEGRFFHVEQERTRLRSDFSGWDKVANALSNTFACTLISTQENLSLEGKVLIYPNPTTHTIHIEGDGLDQIQESHLIYNLYGQNMRQEISILRESQDRLSLDLSFLPSGLYMFMVKDEVKLVYKL